MLMYIFIHYCTLKALLYLSFHKNLKCLYWSRKFQYLYTRRYALPSTFHMTDSHTVQVCQKFDPLTTDDTTRTL